MKKTKAISLYGGVILLLILLILYSARAGSIEMSLSKLVRGPFLDYDSEVATVFDLRLPRITTAIIAGATLTTSGVLLQAVMQNLLTDPGIIGTSSAACLAATLITFLFPALFYAIPDLSVVEGVLAYLLIYSLAWQGESNPTKLILTGVALNMTLIRITDAPKAANEGILTNVQSIIEGNIVQKTRVDVKVVAIYGIVGLLVSLSTMRAYNLLSLEDDTAKSLGVNVNRSRFLVTLIATVLALVSIAIVGVIGFLGLVVPHIGRVLVGSNHKHLLPFSMLLGAIVLLFSDTLGRVIAYPYEVKASVITTVFSRVFFVTLLKIGRKTYGD